jgi:hypothetical protein
MNSLAQRDAEPLIAYEGFCLATECALDENNNLDYPTIAARLRQIHKKVITTDMVRDWASIYNWDYRLKLARAELHEKYKPKFEMQSKELKMRRLTVVNDNIRFMMKACNQLQVIITRGMDELPVKDAIYAYEKFIKLTLLLIEIERQESGEEAYRQTSVNFNVFIAQAREKYGWDYEKTEQMRGLMIQQAERLAPGSLPDLTEMASAGSMTVNGFQ